MRFWLACVLATITALSGYSQQDDWFWGRPIRGVVFDGLVHVNASELEGITAPFVGRALTETVYSEILGRLYALEYFQTISPNAINADGQGNEVIIRFIVTERPTIGRINFQGNSNLRRAELLSAITLNVNDVATQLNIRSAELAITAKYLEKGFPDVSVRSETIPSSDLRVTVNFHITEGQMIAVEEFLFEGNVEFPTRTLRRQLSQRTRTAVFSDGAFQEAKLIADIQALEQFYQERGFINARVIDHAREIRQDDRGRNLMTITFTIYEGRQFTFEGITFQGNRIFSERQLAERVRSRPRELVNMRRLQDDIMRVISLYQENGYIFNRIEPIFDQNEEASTLSVNIDIIERGRAHIEHILITGNTKTQDKVILREIPLIPGDIFSQRRIIDGLRNLNNLQFFSSVFPETPAGSTDFLMDLVINVEEGPTTDVQIGATFSGSADPDTFPASLMAKWADRNFMGTGNTVGAEGTFSPDTQVLSANYMHRWMFGLPLTGNFDFTSQHTRRKAVMANPNHVFNGDEMFAFPAPFDSWEQYEAWDRTPPNEFLMSYDQWRLSVGVGSGYRWSTQAGNLGLGGGFRIGMMYNSFDNNLYTPFDPLLRNKNNQWTPATSVFTSLSLDQRDLFFNPSSGYYAVQRFGWFGLLPRDQEQEHYIRTDTRAEWFITLLDLPVFENWSFKVVFGIHSGLSFILPQPAYGQVYIEEANMLAVDGMFSGRGWLREFRRKGFVLWQNWAEIRIPLAPNVVSWDFFFDAAGVRPNPSDFFTDFAGNDGSLVNHDTFFMRFSMGFGIRFTVPQFPFRLALAKRFLIRDGAVEWQTGDIGGGGRPGSGLDFVFSFTTSTY